MSHGSFRRGEMKLVLVPLAPVKCA